MDDMKTRPHNALDGNQRYQLNKLVEAEFPTAEKTDQQFAEYASSKLGFWVNGNNVVGARKATKVAPYMPPPSTALPDRVEALERKVAELQSELATLRARLGDDT